MTDETLERLTQLEILSAHQTQTIEELSAVLSEQWQTIERMQRQLDGLAKRFVALEDQGAPVAENTKPPHW